jgi:predicted peroxiredoxin
LAEKLVIICTRGVDDAELATIPFVMATAAQASEMEVVLAFQSNGVMLAKKGIAEHVTAAGFPPLKELMDIYLEEGGEMFVCGPCVQARKLDAENDFVAGATVVSGATLVAEIAEAVNVLTY